MGCDTLAAGAHAAYLPQVVKACLFRWSSPRLSMAPLTVWTILLTLGLLELPLLVLLVRSH
jgi:hypothetical protein